MYITNYLLITIFPINAFSGGLGQLGTGLAKLLRTKYGTENIILSDIIRPQKDILNNGKLLNFIGPLEFLRILLAINRKKPHWLRC